MPVLTPLEWVVVVSAFVVLAATRKIRLGLLSLLAGFGTLLLAGEASSALFLSPVAGYWFVGFSVALVNVVLLVLRSELAAQSKVIFIAVMTSLFLGANLGLAIFGKSPQFIPSEPPAADTNGQNLYMPDLTNPPFVLPPQKKTPRRGDIQLMDA